MSWERIPGPGIKVCRDFCSKSGDGGYGRIFLASALLLLPSFALALPPSPPTIPQQKTLEESVWLAESDQLDTLEKAAARLVQENPYSAYGHYLLAELYLKEFKQSPSQLRYLKQASELGQQAMELSPREEYGYIVSAQVLDLMGYTDNALSILEGDSKVPMRESWRVDFLRGQLLTGQTTESVVLKHFDRSMKADAQARNIVIPYVIATMQSHSHGEDLIGDLRVWRERYPHELFDLSLAIALSDNQKYLEAHQIYAQLQKTHADLTEAFINDGIILYSQLNKPKEAHKILSEILEHKGLDVSRRTLVLAHMASLQLQDGRKPDEARKLFAEAITMAKNPMEWVAFSHRAYEKHQRLIDFVGLLDDLRPVLSSSSYLYALQGEVLSERLSLHDRAIESFSSAILLDPERSEFYNGLGLTYYRMHQLDKALAIFNEASKLDPQDATARYNEACVLAILGRTNEALGSLKAAIGLDPRLQQTARLDKDFSSIRVTEQFQSLTSTNPVTAGRP
ncbi:MAG TPA: tetratricopeptide repeat protein [Oligoflexus sp.]|uniref:tetratricopeptide repeat protein n=1 Tax=Oligoflexus sp. TaxID=1971216 RepID=UPI002D2C8094|nr:tetratricopeptide repeat protein [Oligoflexus sp.]HYX34083.1 tetratricopeptide repeat protein [Oligoflexus sp.]